MPSLGDVTAMLVKSKRAGAGRMAPLRGVDDNPGELRMLAYRPAGLAPGAPLVVTLHGCGQGAEAFAAGAGWLDLADRFGFAVLAPEQTAANNPNRCFNWFSRQDAARGGGEAASIAEAAGLMVRAEGLDPRRVFVTGLSAGGAMALAMLAAYPDRFAGGAVIAGLPYGVALDVIQAMSAMQQVIHRSPAELGGLIPANVGGQTPRLAIWHGDADRVVSSGNARAIASQWAHAHGLAEAPDEVVRSPGRTRSSWRTPDGRVAIELNLVAGLGHGVPLAVGGPEGLGQTGPFMLEAGVSSSREIAEFWGIADGRRVTRADPAAAHAAPAPERMPPPPRAPLGEQVMASLGERVPAGVQDVIAKALKSAGLMR